MQGAQCFDASLRLLFKRSKSSADQLDRLSMKVRQQNAGHVCVACAMRGPGRATAASRPRCARSVAGRPRPADRQASLHARTLSDGALACESGDDGITVMQRSYHPWGIRVISGEPPSTFRAGSRAMAACKHACIKEIYMHYIAIGQVFDKNSSNLCILYRKKSILFFTRSSIPERA